MFHRGLEIQITSCNTTTTLISLYINYSNRCFSTLGASVLMVCHFLHHSLSRALVLSTGILKLYPSCAGYTLPQLNGGNALMWCGPGKLPIRTFFALVSKIFEENSSGSTPPLQRFQYGISCPLQQFMARFQICFLLAVFL